MTYHWACCCDDAYCGVPCVGCAVQGGGYGCDDTLPASVCIAEADWDDAIGDVAGTGDGLLVAIDGVWYFFDGTIGASNATVDPAAIDWESALRADECPDCCPHEGVVITWSGSATFEGICCGETSTWETAWSCSITNKVSPTMYICAEGETPCASDQEHAGWETITAGDACGGEFLDPIPDSGSGARLRFNIDRDWGSCQWKIRISVSGFVAGLTECAFECNFVAPLSVCPPRTGWTLESETHGAEPSCDSLEDAGTSDFDAGGVTLEFI